MTEVQGDSVVPLSIQLMSSQLDLAVLRKHMCPNEAIVTQNEVSSIISETSGKGIDVITVFTHCWDFPFVNSLHYSICFPPRENLAEFSS